MLLGCARCCRLKPEHQCDKLFIHYKTGETLINMKVEQGSYHSTSPFPAVWAFVIQFHESADIKAGRWEGRVEHVVSGQRARFHRHEELLAFFTEVLQAQERDTSDG
jgi:hypothetical protein